MRKEQDYYFKKAKKDNYPARSVYKLEEAQVKYRFLRPGQRVLDLGCHPGSWSLYAAGIVGAKGLVVGADLQRTDLAVQKADAEIQWLCYDVCSDEFVEYLQTHWPGFHVVLSDMAPRTTGSLGSSPGARRSGSPVSRAPTRSTAPPTIHVDPSSPSTHSDLGPGT